MEGFRQTNHFRHALQQTTRFLQTVPHVEMKMRPKTRVLAFRLSKHSSHFSSSSVGASLHSYFLTAALVKNVLINVVTKSRLTSCSQPCTDSRVVPPLDHPTDAMEELSLKANVIQIAHPLHPPKAPDKAIHCQVPILYSPLKQARLHLEFIPPYMTFAMIVFNSYGSRRNILAHKVFDKMQQRGIAQKYVPDLLLVPHHLREITKSVPDFLLVEFGEPIDYSAYLDTISQPTKIPRKLKSSRQYREYMGNLLAYLIYFFQRTEPLQDLNRIFLKVATALEEHWADGLSRQLSIHFFGTQLRDGSIFAYFASKQLPGVLTSRCLRNNRPHQIVLRLPNRRLAILCVQMGVIELVVKSLIQSYLGVMSRIQACKTVEEYGHSEFKAVSCWKTIWHDLANTGGIHNFELKYIDGMSHTHRLLQEFKLLWSSYLDEHTEISYASLVLLSRWFWTSIIIAEDTCCLAPRFIQRSHGTTAYMYGVGLTNIVEKLHVALASLGLKTGGTVQRVVATILGFPIALSTGTFAGVSLCSMDIFLRLIGKVPKWEFTGRGYMICSTIWNNILTIMANSMFSTFMSGLIKVISTFTLSSHMIDTTSVCLVVYNCNPCAITFLFGSIIIVSPTIYFLGYLFPNKIGSRMLLGRKMQQAPPWSDGFFVLIWEVFMTATCWAFPLAEEEMTIIPSRAFSPSLVSRMQWRPGSSFQNQNEGMFHGRTEIAPDQREFFLQRLQQVQQQGHSTILGMPPLVGGNHKQFSAHQNPLLQQFNSQNSSVPSQAGLGLGVQPPVLGTVAPTTLQQQLNPIHQQSNQEALMSSGLTEDHKRANYRMLCADSLLYLRDYQAIQSSMECLNWWAIPSKIFGVLPNNNCPSVSNLGVFLFTMVSLSLPIVHSWVCNLLEHLFISTNSDLIVFSATSWIDHPLGVTEPQNLNAHIRSCLFMTTITATWVPAAQNACLTRKHLIRLLDTKRVRQSLLLHDARQSGALPLLSSIVSENQLDRHCDSFGESQLLNTSFPV